jgi:hypothetical protein
MFTTCEHGRLFANIKEVNGRGPEPMKPTDSGTFFEEEKEVVGSEVCCDKTARTVDSSRLQRST